MGTEMGRGWDLGDGGIDGPSGTSASCLGNTYLQTILRITSPDMESGWKGGDDVMMERIQFFWKDRLFG